MLIFYVMGIIVQGKNNLDVGFHVGMKLAK